MFVFILIIIFAKVMVRVMGGKWNKSIEECRMVTMVM